MKEIKIVSAFFDIGRGDYETHKRSTDQYFEYFRFWARIQNELIVYCDPENVDRIRKIREEFGRGDQTTVIPVVLEEIEPEILARMRQVEQDEGFQSFRYLERDPSNTALYDYVMLLKWWCMADAAKTREHTEQLAWVDFGFNHGGSKYIRSEDFDFHWVYNYPYKLSAFCLNDPDKMALIDSLQFQHDCFTGCSFALPVGLCAPFWTYMKEAMSALLDVGCIDDDQHLMLMVYKKQKEQFSIQIANWFEMFLLNSDQTFTLREHPIPSIPVRAVRKLQRTLKKVHVKKSSFIKRMEQKERKYYG
jgi:protein YibB